MPAREPDYLAILKQVLAAHFVPFLPPLLGNANPTDQAEKQLSRAFSAFALHKLLDITPQAAAASVLYRKAEIEGALDTCSHIKLVVPYTGDSISQTARDALQALLDDEDLDEERLVKQVEYHMATEIARDLLAEQAYQPVHTDVALQKHAKVESPRATYYGVARLADLVALHQTHSKALYKRNIRYFLGSSRSNVNKAIKVTLRDDPGSFFYLNNGVTAASDEIEPKGKNASSRFQRFKVRGLSIINGAQTVASAAEFVAQHPGSNIDDAKVMLTLIKAPADRPFGKRVSKARNHQNPVQTANFATLDENQERLRQEVALLAFLVVEVGVHHRVGHLPDSHLPHVHVLDEPTAHGIRLQAQRAVQVRAVHPAVLGEDVPHPARHLAADGHSAVPVLHRAAAHDHVLGGLVQPPSVAVAPALDRDAVVARVELAAFNQHVHARLGVAPVVVRPVRPHLYVPHRHIPR